MRGARARGPLAERAGQGRGGGVSGSEPSERVEVNGLSLGHPLNFQGSQATDRMSGSGRRKRAARRVAGNGRRQRQRKRPETGVPWGRREQPRNSSEDTDEGAVRRPGSPGASGASRTSEAGDRSPARTAAPLGAFRSLLLTGGR